MSTDLVVNGVMLGYAGSYILSNLPAMPATVAPGGSFTFNVTYNPAISGWEYNYIQLSCNDPDDPYPYVWLNGNGIDPFIRSWLLNGIYSSDDITQDFIGGETMLSPRAGDTNAGKAWFVYSSATPQVSLDPNVFGDHDHYVAYAAAYIFADRPKNCEIWTGVDDGIRLFLNGSLLGDYISDHGYVQDEYHFANISLKAGWNRLMVKVHDLSEALSFSVRFANPDGSPVAGISFSQTPADLTVEPSDCDYGIVSRGSFADRDFLVTNNGSETVYGAAYVSSLETSYAPFYFVRESTYGLSPETSYSLSPETSYNLAPGRFIHFQGAICPSCNPTLCGIDFILRWGAALFPL